MKQRILIASVVSGLVALAFATSATAQNPGAITDAAGGLNTSSLMPGSAGNAAGLLQFCIANNYLGVEATSTRDRLLAKIGGADAANQDSGYSSGAQGMLTDSDGRSTVDITKMGSLENNLTQQACGAVLKNASSLL